MTHYVIVRKDLPLGVMASQITHAAGESSPGNLPSTTYAVVLAARDEEQLLELSERLYAADIPHVLIREPDSPWNNAAMALGVSPCDRSRVRKHLSQLPLLR